MPNHNQLTRVLTAIVISAALLSGNASSAAPAAGKDQGAKVGDAAAPLDGLTFIKGQPVTIERGQIYLVEFWATWCGPCIKNIPHLTKLQEVYKGKSVNVIGITDEKDLGKVKAFVDKQGDGMAYTVAADPGRTVYGNYMTAYGLRGIPSAFLIDKEGRVAWVGHPQRGMDEVLEMLAADEFDLDAYVKEQEEKRLLREKVSKITRNYYKSLRAGAGVEESRKIAGRLFKLGNPEVLAGFALDILDSEDAKGITCDFELALKAARQANTDVGEKDPDIMDTYAMALAKTDQLELAIQTQEKALSLMPQGEESNMRKHMQKRLEDYRKQMSAGKAGN